MDHKPINRDFYEKSQAFVIAALRLLESCLEKGEHIRYAQVEKSEIVAGGGFGTALEIRPLYSELVQNHIKEIESLPEYNTCIQAMISDPTISKHLRCMIRIRMVGFSFPEWGYLRPLLMDQFSKRSKGLNFDKKTFDRAYGSLEQFYYNEMIPLQALSPLDNFNSDTYEIDLGEGLRIRQMTLDELGQILDRVKQPYQISRLKYAMELTYQTQKILGEPWRVRNPEVEVNEREKFDKLVTALRLFKAGVVGFNIVLTTPLMRIPLLGGSGSGNLDNYRSFVGHPYNLNESEVPEFRNFWNDFSKMELSKPASLTVAIRRFSYAYERWKTEDKLIDYMVAFEALFSREHEESESIGYKLSVRAARFLAKDYLQRRQIMKEMKDFYRLRSNIVHGEALKPKDELGNTVGIIEDYLRRTIKLLIEQLQTSDKDEIILHLDLD